MLPDASHALSSHYAFPLVYLTAACGFLLIWSLDKLNFSDRQLDNSALLSMAVKNQRSTICYVSVKPVVLSYGSFRRNIQAEPVRQAADRVQRLAGDGGGKEASWKGSAEGAVAMEEGWLDALKGGGADLPDGGVVPSGAKEAKLHDGTRVAVYPTLTVVPIEESKEAALPVDLSSCRAHSSASSYHTCSGGARTPQSSKGRQLSGVPLLDGQREKLVDDDDEDEDAEEGHSHEHLHHHHISIPAHALLPIFLAFVFSVHSAIEGLALGAQAQVGGSALSLLIAISSHKLIEAISVGANFVKQGVALTTALPVLGIYTLMTPGGILAGWGLSHAMGGGGEGEDGEGDGGEVSWGVLFQSLLQAFAAGSFLYLAVHEVSDEKCCAVVKRWQQIVLMMAGVGVMALLAVWV